MVCIFRRILKGGICYWRLSSFTVLQKLKYMVKIGMTTLRNAFIMHNKGLDKSKMLW